MKKNIVVAVNSLLIKTLIKETFINDNIIEISSIDELFRLGNIENAVFIVENAFLYEINPGYLMALSEKNNNLNKSILLITSNPKLITLYSITLPNIIVSSNENIKISFERLEFCSIDFAINNQYNVLNFKTYRYYLYQKFLEVYSNNILDNLLDLNTYFNELIYLFNLIFDIDKLLIEFKTDYGTYIFTTLQKDSLNLIYKSLENYKIFNPENTVELHHEDIHHYFPININGDQKGKFHIFYRQQEVDDTLFELTPALLNILKKFYYFLSTTLYKEAFRNKCVDLDKIKIILNTIFNEPLPDSIKIINTRSHTSSFKKDDSHYIISTHTSLYNHSIITIYFYHLTSSLSDFSEILNHLNIFIHKNLLKFFPTPLSVIKIENDKLLFSATNNMPLVNSESSDLIFCNNSYFGMYKNLDIDFKMLNIKRSLTYIHLPDYLFFSEEERKKILDKVRNDY